MMAVKQKLILCLMFLTAGAVQATTGNNLMSNLVVIQKGGELVAWSDKKPGSIPAGPFSSIMSAMDFTMWCALRQAGGNLECFPSTSAYGLNNWPQNTPVKALMRNYCWSANLCVIKSADSKVLCWGSEYKADGKHRLDGGWPYYTAGPVSLVALGYTGGCALKEEDDTAVCWHHWTNCDGCTDANYELATKTPFIDLAIAHSTVCGVKAENGKLLCWGNDAGCLISSAPMDTPFKSLVAGGPQFCGIKAEDSKMVCWGCNIIDHTGGPILGQNAYTYKDDLGGLPYPHDTPLLAVALGYDFGCGISSADDKLQCWGVKHHWKNLEPPQIVPAVDLLTPTDAKVLCTVPTIAVGIHSWNGTNCASGAATVVPGTTCAIAAAKGYTCTSPGLCGTDGKFAATGACQESANCTATHMTCPVPSVASGTYQILGSETATNCSMQNSGNRSFFRFTFGSCNSTRTIRPALNLVEETITMVYRPAHTGSLLIVGRQSYGGANASAVVVCTCTAPMTALASSGTLGTADWPKAGGKSNIIGNTDFGVSFDIYSNDSFNTVLPLGSMLPASLQRLYFKVTSDSPTDIIGLVNCTASPTSNITDAYAVRFLNTSCAVGPLDYRAYPETETHATHSSLLNFKFAGSTGVFIWCSVIRCLEEPCGECVSSQSRRLEAAAAVARQLQGQGKSVQAWFQAQFSTTAVILPGPLLSQGNGLVMWEPAAAPLLGSSDMRSNLTLLGFAANASTSLKHLASAVSTALSSLFLHKVQVLRILAAVPPSTRLLSAGPEAGGHLRTEATIVESAISVESEEATALVFSKITSLSRGGEASFVRSLRMQMESRGLNAPAHLQVVVGHPLSITPTATPMFGQAREDVRASSGLAVTSAMVIISAACLITCSVCALLAFLWRRDKRQRGLCPESTSQSKVANTTQDASGVRPALSLANSYNTTQDVSGKNDESSQGNGVAGFLDTAQDVIGKSDESKQGNGVSGFLDTAQDGTGKNDKSNQGNVGSSVSIKANI
mmetsp:Transcript_138866/g.276919  ORF Transcript_138866/g.276919 Transcript_138866/m.276919 type:complete len:1013 (+) Transcript_138866:99-3137(+)